MCFEQRRSDAGNIASFILQKNYKINDDFHSVLLLAQQNCNIFYFLCQYLNALITTSTIFIKKFPICYQS